MVDNVRTAAHRVVSTRPLRGRAEDRFWRYVAPDADTHCWAWTGAIRPDGYGYFWPGSGSRYAHRFAYKLLVGNIPRNLELDHLCRNRGCVNPGHLEPVSRLINIHRSPIAPSAINARKTHCKRGHAFVGDNIIWLDAGRRRNCRECRRLRQRGELIA